MHAFAAAWVLYISCMAVEPKWTPQWSYSAGYMYISHVVLCIQYSENSMHQEMYQWYDFEFG